MDRRANLPGTTQGPHSTPTPETLGWGDGSIKYSPSGVRVCPPWPKGQAGRWHGPCARAAKEARAGVPALPRGGTGRTRQGDSGSVRTRNPPHPARGSRRAHTPEAVSASRGRRRYPPTGRTARPQAEESSPFRAGRMSMRCASAACVPIIPMDVPSGMQDAGRKSRTQRCTSKRLVINSLIYQAVVIITPSCGDTVWYSVKQPPI